MKKIKYIRWENKHAPIFTKETDDWNIPIIETVGFVEQDEEDYYILSPHKNHEKYIDVTSPPVVVWKCYIIEEKGFYPFLDDGE